MQARVPACAVSLVEWNAGRLFQSGKWRRRRRDRQTGAGAARALPGNVDLSRHWRQRRGMVTCWAIYSSVSSFPLSAASQCTPRHGWAEKTAPDVRHNKPIAAENKHRSGVSAQLLCRPPENPFGINKPAPIKPLCVFVMNAISNVATTPWTPVIRHKITHSSASFLINAVSYFCTSCTFEVFLHL